MDKNSIPRVSMGLPVYNGANYLRDALDSLLAQTYTDFEVVISDNASTDETGDICREYAARDGRIRYHRSDTNRGAAWNFNNAFHLARGEYFRWAAHDDMVQPEFLDRCVEHLDAHPGTVLCFTRTVFIDENNHQYKEHVYPYDLVNFSPERLFMYYIGAHHINTEIFGLIRTAELAKTRLIDGFVGSDFVMLGELTFYGSFHQVPEVLFTHREHSGRSTKSTSGPEEYTEWFDSSKKVKFALPFWRRLFACAGSVARHPLPLARKWKLNVEIFRSVKWNRHYLWAETKRAAGKLL